MIGEDFQPINFTLFGLNLTDPMDFVYDTILGVLSLYFAFRVSQLPEKGNFIEAWRRFFLFFGIATFLGAFGHVFYNYFHYFGKLFGWLIIPISIYWIEMAMINAHWDKKIIAKAKKMYLGKMGILYLAFLVVWITLPVYEKPSLLFLPIAINTILGLLIGVGIFSYHFKHRISASFIYIFSGIVVIFPSAFIFLMKINIHPWFTKNDFSHILMIFGISLFYYGLMKIIKEEHDFIEVN